MTSLSSLNHDKRHFNVSTEYCRHYINYERCIFHSTFILGNNELNSIQIYKDLTDSAVSNCK